MINEEEFNKNIREIPNKELIDCYRGNYGAVCNNDYVSSEKWHEDWKVIGLIEKEILRRMENGN